MEWYENPRLIQAKEIIDSIIPTTDRSPSNKIMITRDNTPVIIVKDTAIYITNLVNVEFGDMICCEYSILTQIFIKDEKKNLIKPQISSSYINQFFNNPMLFKIIENTYILYTRIVSQQENLLAIEPELRGDDEIERLIKAKVADGCQFFQLHGKNIGENYFFPFFTGFPVVKKTDRIGLSVYKYDDTYLVNVMDIYKKVINRNIRVIYRTINLNKRG